MGKLTDRRMRPFGRTASLVAVVAALLALGPALGRAANTHVGVAGTASASRSTPAPTTPNTTPSTKPRHHHHKKKARLKLTLLIHYKVRGQFTRIRGLQVPQLGKRGIVYVACAGYYWESYCPWQGLLKVHNRHLGQLIGWLHRYSYHDGLRLAFTFEAPHKKPAIFLLHFRNRKRPALKYYGD